jgi:hypothetical protein
MENHRKWGLPDKGIHRGEHAGTFASYHRTSWDNIPLILKEDCICPANSEEGVQEFPNSILPLASLATLARLTIHKI